MGINRGIEHLLAQVNPVPTIKLSTHFSIMQHCVDFRPRCSLQIWCDVILTTLDLERHVYTIPTVAPIVVVLRHAEEVGKRRSWSRRTRRELHPPLHSLVNSLDDVDDGDELVTLRRHNCQNWPGMGAKLGRPILGLTYGGKTRKGGVVIIFLRFYLRQRSCNAGLVVVRFFIPSANESFCTKYSYCTMHQLTISLVSG